MKHLNEGEVIFVKGSAKDPYEIKCSGGVISCSCPAWRNQSLKIDQRTCKHIKANVSNGFGTPAVVAQSPSTISPTFKAKQPPPCLLAHTWDRVSNVSSWLVSYKLDGVRAWWDGYNFWSRLGNEYMAPQWFKDKMPAGMVLDGELFAGNGRFQETVSYVRKMNPIDAEWKNIKYMVFDCPLDKRPFEERVAVLKKLVKNNACLDLLEQTVMDKPVDFYLKDAEAQGYEGVMLRQPGSLYEEGRSHTLLKVKSFKDCEATVIGYEKGKGRHKGRVGALKVRLSSGVEFDVGTGLSDAERENPPTIGSIITVRYQELSKDGVCRFPSYWRKYHE